MHRARPRRWEESFTLLEVLLASALLMVLMTALYMTWSATMRGWKAGSDAADDLQKTRAILDGVGTMFRSAAYYDQVEGSEQNENLYLFEGVHGTFGANDADSVTFVTFSSRFLRPYESIRMPLRRVRISLEQDEHRQPYLALYSENALKADDSEPTVPVKLSGDVIGFRVRYYDPDLEDWEDNWQDQVGMPGEVEITLTYKPAGEDQPPVVQQLVASIPAHEAAEQLNGGTLSTGGTSAKSFMQPRTAR